MRTLVLGGCLLGLAALALGQSLGEVAKQTKEQRKGAGAAKTLTQDDVDRAAQEREATAPPKSTPRPRATPARTPPPAPGGVIVLQPPSTESRAMQPETSDATMLEAKIQRWRERYSKVQDRIEALERELEKAKDEEEDPPTMSGRRRQYYSRVRDLQAQLARLEQQRDAIMEQARLDGVSSGQLY